jgi:hypothetical protein
MPTSAITSTNLVRRLSPSGELGRTLKGDIAMLDHQTIAPRNPAEEIP